MKNVRIVSVLVTIAVINFPFYSFSADDTTTEPAAGSEESVMIQIPMSSLRQMLGQNFGILGSGGLGIAPPGTGGERCFEEVVDPNTCVSIPCGGNRECMKCSTKLVEIPCP